MIYLNSIIIYRLYTVIENIYVNFTGRLSDVIENDIIKACFKKGFIKRNGLGGSLRRNIIKPP